MEDMKIMKPITLKNRYETHADLSGEIAGWICDQKPEEYNHGPAECLNQTLNTHVKTVYPVMICAAQKRQEHVLTDRKAVRAKAPAGAVLSLPCQHHLTHVYACEQVSCRERTQKLCKTTQTK